MRRSVALAVIVVELAAAAALLGAAWTHWRSTGWAGFGWQTYGPAGASLPMPWLAATGLEEGKVVLVDRRSPAAAAGITEDDVVVAVDRRPSRELWSFGAAPEHAPGDVVSFTLQRDGAEREVEVILVSPLASPTLVAGMAVSVLVALAYLAISLVVAWARPGSPSTVFFLLSASGAAAFVLWAAAEPALPDLSGTRPLGNDPSAGVWIAAVLLLSTVMVNLLLHFTLVFPRRRPVLERWPAVVVWIHTLPFLPMLLVAGTATAGITVGRSALGTVTVTVIGAGLVALLVALVRALRRADSWRGILDHPWLVQGVLLTTAWVASPVLTAGLADEDAVLAGLLVALLLMAWVALTTVVWSAATCVALARSYREAGPEAHRQLRWVLWGLAAPIVVSLLLMAVGFVVGLLGGLFGVDRLDLQLALGTLSKLSYTLIPLAFAFGILRSRLMDVDLLIRRTLVYGGLTAFVALAYLGLVGLLGVPVVQALGLKSWTTAVLATVAIAAACVPVRRWLQRAVDRRLSRLRLDRAALLVRADAAVLDATEGRSIQESLPPAGGGTRGSLTRRAEDPEKPMSTIVVDHQPTAATLDRLGVTRWPIWTKEVSTFPWSYDEPETCYFLAGKVTVTPDGGEPVTVGAGDLVTFPAGMDCTWNVIEAVRKHYRFG